MRALDSVMAPGRVYESAPRYPGYIHTCPPSLGPILRGGGGRRRHTTQRIGVLVDYTLPGPVVWLELGLVGLVEPHALDDAEERRRLSGRIPLYSKSTSIVV